MVTPDDGLRAAGNIEALVHLPALGEASKERL